MIAEANLFGVYFSGALVEALAAFIALMIIRPLLRWLGFYQIVWHRRLVDIGLFVILWGVMVETLPPLGGAGTWLR
ncbi:MAG TPA: DUF1656 domain-containing protein [Methylovirgula sp.]